MPLYVPPAGADPADLIEQLGADIADVYNRLELRLLKQVAKKLRAGRNTWTQADRARIIAELRDYTQRLVAQLPADLPAQVIAIAAEHGTIAAAATLGAAKIVRSKTVPTTPAMQHAVAAVQADLTNAFDQVRSRILRYPVDQLGRWLGPAGDVYQRTIADTVTGPLMNAEVKESARRLAVRRFLDQGVTGFTDITGRRWRIGTYAEMATRTAVTRAYTDATVWQSQQSGINLAQVVIGYTACSHCGAWAGKTLSTDGTPAGDYQMPSMLGDGAVTVHVDGTVDEARAAGWQHPNCRCFLVPHIPGGTSTATNLTRYDPDAEAARDKQRYMERRVRSFKRRAATAEDDAEATKWKRRARDEQARIRSHVAEHDLPRRSRREQLWFSDGRASA